MRSTAFINVKYQMFFSACLPSGGQHVHVIIFPGIIHCMQYTPTAP